MIEPSSITPCSDLSFRSMGDLDCICRMPSSLCEAIRNFPIKEILPALFFSSNHFLVVCTYLDCPAMLTISSKSIATTARCITFFSRRAIATSCVYRRPPQKEVPVTTYSENDKSKTTLKVNIDGQSSKHGQADDLNRKAERFDNGLVDRLTPTMRNFTLEGKVALVTG